MNSTTRVGERFRPGLAFLLAVVLVLSSYTAGATPMFSGLGDLPGGLFRSAAMDVSGDGTVVTGWSMIGPNNRIEGFRWTAQGGMVALGTPPGEPNDVTTSAGSGISKDGSTIVGYGRFPSLYSKAIQWGANLALTEIGTQPAGGNTSTAIAVSEDGSVIVGVGNTTEAYNQAFYWTESSGVVSLGNLLGGSGNSIAYDVSDDGNIIVGQTDIVQGGTGFIWDATNGMRSVGDLGEEPHFSNAYGISGDGNVVVGGNGNEAYRWTAETGMVSLGTDSNLLSSLAYAASQDGSVIVGFLDYIEPYGTHRAFVWDEAHGTREIAGVLSQLGIDFTGWELQFANAISDDGRTIVGVGINPNGDLEGWIATIPEPGTALLVCAGLAMIATQRIRSRRAF